MIEKALIVVVWVVFIGLVLFYVGRLLKGKPSNGGLINPKEDGSANPVKAKKAQPPRKSLMDLYPRDLAREMVKDYLKAMPPSTLSDKDLKEFSRRAFGDKADKLSPPTPEWNAAYNEAEIERETDKAIKHMSACWKTMIGTLRLRAKGGDVHFNDLLEPNIPLNVSSGVTWLEASIVSLKLNLEQARKLQEAFVMNLRHLIDSSLEGYSLWGDDHIIIMSWAGYTLLAPTTTESSVPQP